MWISESPNASRIRPGLRRFQGPRREQTAKAPRGNGRSVGQIRGGSILVNRRCARAKRAKNFAFRALPLRHICASVRPHWPGGSNPIAEGLFRMTLPDRLARPLRAPSMWRASGILGLAAACLLVLALPLRAQDADPVVARVNGADIRASDLSIAEEELGSNLPAMAGEAKRDYLVAYLSDTLLVAQAAETQKLADTADFKRRLAFARNKLLSETLLQQEAKAALSDTAMRKVYDDAVKQMGAEKEVHARHILVETEDEAKQIAAELKQGADFNELAKRSKEPGAAERGGDLGYFTKDQMVPAFAEAAFKLEPGKVSDPVKSEFGWHVIKVKDQIETYLARRSQSEMVAKLRADAKIERVEAKTPAAPTPAPATEPKK